MHNQSQMQDNSCFSNPKDSTNKAIRKIFSSFYGSKIWAARQLNVNRATITHWLSGHVTSSRLDAEMPVLAQQLVASGGACIGRSIGGQTVRSRIKRLRPRG